MSGVTIYTANMGGYDTPRGQVEQDIDVDWQYHCDGHDPFFAPPAPWQLHDGWIPGKGLSANLAAKVFKCQPADVLGTIPTRYAIWIDANMEIVSPSFAREALDALVYDGDRLRDEKAPLAVFRHPRRDNVYDEVDATCGAERQGDKYDLDKLRAQLAWYEDAGYDTRSLPLYACGVLAWDLHHPQAAPLGEQWYRECVEWTPQDQVSFPVVCDRVGVTPGVFPFPQLERHGGGGMGGQAYFGNRWLRIHPHRERVQ